MSRMARGKDKTDKLVRYLKEDRPKKFKACVKKYSLDISKAVLPKGRTYLHYAAKFGSGSLINFLTESGVAASKPNHKGDLPFHMAVMRALRLCASDASEVYFDTVMPLLEAYPLALDVDSHQGNTGQELLKKLKEHLKREDHRPQSNFQSHSPDAEWKEKLASEFESESAEFFGRYDYEDDFTQESEREKEEWVNHMWMRGHKRHQHSIRLSNTEGRKRRLPQQDPQDAPGPSSAKKTTLDGEELKKARAKMQEAYKLRQEQDKKDQYRRKRTEYETHYQKMLADSGKEMLGYNDIPWPSKGSVQSVIDVLFQDLGIKCKTALKKYVRQQQVRWHPDKFLQRFGERIEEQSKEQVLERVKQISQAINKRAEIVGTDTN